MFRIQLFLLLAFCFYVSSHAQVASDCTSAIAICNNTPINGGTNGYGIDDFNGAIETGCLERSTSGVIESNSAWYQFRTNSAGQLGFNIGHDSVEDWDFALYQTDDCSNLGEPVRCNFFDNGEGVSFTGVGEDPTGLVDSVHYDDWLEVEAGQHYFLVLNNFSNSNSGFSIQFSGNIFVENPFDALDCSIVDNLLGPPVAACEGETVVLEATTTGASYRWFLDTGNGFQEIPMETQETLDVTSSGAYRVEVTAPMETIISEVQIVFSSSPTANPMLDEVVCFEPDAVFDLTLKDFEVLGAQDPAMYLVSYHLTQDDADNGFENLPKMYPLEVGVYQIHARVSSLQNPHCFDTSQRFELTVLQNPNALDFPTNVIVCEGEPTVTIGDVSANPNPEFNYAWSSGETTPSIVVSAEGVYSLIVTNSFDGTTCAVTRSVTVSRSSLPVIADIEISDLQDSNTIRVIPGVDGDFEYSLDEQDFQEDPTFFDVIPGEHTLTMRDIFGCGSVTETIAVVGIPDFFTPNGDSYHQLFEIAGLSSLREPIVNIYDRYGKLLAQLTNKTGGWDGTLDGTALPSSDYWVKLSFLNAEGNRVEAKFTQNHFTLKR